MERWPKRRVAVRPGGALGLEVGVGHWGCSVRPPGLGTDGTASSGLLRGQEALHAPAWAPQRIAALKFKEAPQTRSVPE